ncbi:NosD domain-containing protein [Halococcus agarilyticus]|uniref:NosD domain-containing protein n=1 Tax=Halococcus agarilyticus TaxID=1232219 RepID=UPI000677B986|nr:NosD domain-containing protein [Halococcus agarilyticus]
MGSLWGFGDDGTDDHRALLVGVVVVALLAAGTLVGVAGAQSAGNGTVGVDSCRTIDSSGEYVLTANVTGGEGNCITIAASDVTLDGAGHTLEGSGSGHAIHANGTARAVENVTVRRIQTSNWTVGVFYLGVVDSTIRGTIANNNTEGIKLARATGNRLVDNTAYANGLGMAIGGQSQNNTLRGNVAVENKWGIHFERDSPNNTVVDNAARNNSRWDYYSLRNGGTNTVTDLRLAVTTVSFTERNVGLRSTTDPPEIPQDTRSLGTFVETTGTGGAGSEVSLTMGYDNPNGSSVVVYRNDGEFWADVDRATIDASSSTVTVPNITEFGTFAPLAAVPGASGGSVNVSAGASPSVQRTLTPVASPPTVSTTTENVTANTTATPPGNVTANTTTTDGTTASDVAVGDPPTNATSPTTTGMPTTTDTPETIAPSNDTATNGSTTPPPETGESEGTSASIFGVARLVLVLLGVVGLAVLGVAAVRQTR